MAPPKSRRRRPTSPLVPQPETHVVVPEGNELALPPEPVAEPAFQPAPLPPQIYHTEQTLPEPPSQELPFQQTFQPAPFQTAPLSVKVTPAMPKPPSQQTFEHIGDILASVRQQRGEDLGDISDYLRIRPSYLFALEESRYEDLPADAYVIGFLRTYANYLGLDGRAAIDQYRKEMAGRRRKPHLSMPQPMTEGQAPSLPIIGGALAAFVLIYLLWYSLSGSEQSAASKTPVLSSPVLTAPATTTPAPSGDAPVTNGTLPAVETPATPAPVVAPVAPQPTPTPAPTESSVAPTITSGSAAVAAMAASTPAKALTVPTPAPLANAADSIPVVSGPAIGTPAPTPTPAASKTLVLRAEQNSWVLVTDAKGSSLLDRVMKPGETFTLPQQKGLKLTTGNAGGVILSLDGTDLAPLGPQSRVLRNYPLDSDKLKP